MRTVVPGVRAGGVRARGHQVLLRPPRHPHYGAGRSSRSRCRQRFVPPFRRESATGSRRRSHRPDGWRPRESGPIRIPPYFRVRSSAHAPWDIVAYCQGRRLPLRGATSTILATALGAPSTPMEVREDDGRILATASNRPSVAWVVGLEPGSLDREERSSGAVATLESRAVLGTGRPYFASRRRAPRRTEPRQTAEIFSAPYALCSGHSSPDGRLSELVSPCGERGGVGGPSRHGKPAGLVKLRANGPGRRRPCGRGAPRGSNGEARGFLREGGSRSVCVRRTPTVQNSCCAKRLGRRQDLPSRRKALCFSDSSSTLVSSSEFSSSAQSVTLPRRA